MQTTIPRTFPDCPTCIEIDSPCEHHQQFLDAEAYIKAIYPPMDIVDVSEERPADYWRGGKTVDYGIVWIWRSACRLYGWAMLTAILLHEYGHKIAFDMDRQLKGLVCEDAANLAGYTSVPPALVPEHYWEYRNFFLGSYHDEEAGTIWNEQICFAEYNKWLLKMFASSPSPSVAQ